LIQTFSKSSHHVFWEIASSYGFALRDESLDIFDIVCEVFDLEPFLVSMISIADEADLDIKFALTTLDHIVNDLLQGCLCSLNPTRH
jgi:hypothetical protein